jgi:hypothetical protein
MIIYKGPSMLDGAPIIVIAVTKSGNGKTGDMVQTYILREDIDPREASKTGQDFSICGKCIHRGTPSDDVARKLAKGRTCYVRIGQGPLIVWRKYKRGGYRVASGVAAIAAIGAGRMVRLGTYGDPAAVPAYVWRAILSRAVGHTGYSHQMDQAGAQFDAETMMVSADSLDHAKAAWHRGARTFRVVSRNDWSLNGRQALDKTEVLCPASKEAGYKSTCNDCGLCSGTSSKSTRSVAIVAHGASANMIARVAA